MRSNRTSAPCRKRTQVPAKSNGQVLSYRLSTDGYNKEQNMERLAQYLDNLEDLVFAFALKAERLRQAACFFLFMATSASLQVAGVILALKYPPLAMGIVTLLVVGVLFRSVVVYPAGSPASA